MSSPQSAVTNEHAKKGEEKSRLTAKHMTFGIVLMLAGLAIYPITDAFLKHLMSLYSVPQTTFLRSLTRAVPLLVLACFQGGPLRVLATQNPGRHAVRLLVNLGSTYAFMMAFSMSSLTTIYTLSYTSPLFMILLSYFLLKEKVDKERWIAVGIGLIGVIIAIRPGSQVFAWTSLIVLGGTALAALNKILMRRLSKTEHLLSIAIYPNITMMMVTLPFVIGAWKPMALEHWGIFAFVGLLTASAQYAIAKALKFAEASMLAPIDYSTFFWVVMLDAFVWNSLPDTCTVVGACIIVLSNFFILWKSRRDEMKKVPVVA
jgi:drug/metabolite transporter (DMT)-like permease